MPVELDEWMTRIEARHLADLTFAEVSRALRALSSAYVERRDTAIPGGRVLDTAGKRAAFALYYGPLHFAAARRVLEGLGVPHQRAGTIRGVVDLGCGTGAVGAAVASWMGVTRLHGIDLHPWAVDEARRTYAAFGLDAIVTRGSAARMRRPPASSFVVAAYLANELPQPERDRLRDGLLDAVRHGSELLVIEPLSGRAAPWWPAWVDAFGAAGAQADTWTLTLTPPELTRRLGTAAGLTTGVAKVRSIHAGRRDPVK